MDSHLFMPAETARRRRMRQIPRVPDKGIK